ncbi:MAG: ADOP family duplicated permease [Candidatus Acidiferrales bacterium]
MLSDLLIRVRALMRRDVVERELDEELRFHFEEQVEKFVKEGVPRDEARRRARLEFGGAEGIKEECREARGVHFVETLAQDVRYGVRMLGKNWKPASIAAFSLGVAMALSVAGLSVFDGIMLRPPVAAEPGRLVTIYTTTPTREFDDVSYPDYKYYRDNNQTFSGVAAFSSEISKLPVEHGREDEIGTMEVTSDNYFSVMGIRPFLGQLFSPGDDDRKTPSAVLSYASWRRWGSNPKIVGERIVVNGHALTIAGVAPKNVTGVVFGFGADIFITVATNAEILQYPQSMTERTERRLFLIGRLKPGVTQERARADLRTMSAQLAAAYPEADKVRAAVLTSTTVLPPDARSTAALISGALIGIVLMVLLVACANVANLLLGLATGRRQEILIRTALGATRGRLIRQLLTESAILCVAGGAAGFLLASAALRRFSQFDTPVPILGTIYFAPNLRTDGDVLAMTLALIFIASLATGMAPAVHACAPNVAGALSGEAVIGGTRKGLIRNALVVIQIAVCTLVMVGAGLCLRSVRNLEAEKPGFSERNLAGVIVDLQSNGYSEAQGQKLYAALRQSASLLYGVKSCSLGLEFPFIDDHWATDEMWSEGGSDATHAGAPVPVNVVDGEYFATLGIPLLAGRTFDSSDTKESPEVVVINHKMAETHWPGGDPIGKKLHIENGNRVVTVSGVVGDGKYNTLDEAQRPVIYYALSQHYQPEFLLIVQTQGNPRQWVQPLAQLVRNFGVKLEAPPFTLDDVMHFTLLVPLLTLGVVVGLGALALMLAILGLYGAIFYSVNERRKEIGIRVALGAQASDLMKMILGQAAIIAGAGVLAGLLLGAGATVAFRTQFYGISAIEMHVLIPVALTMVLISMAVAYAAARPWIGISPMDAVRHT